MAAIRSNRFSFSKPTTYWDVLQARRQRSKAFREDAAASSADTSSRLGAAWSDQITGPGNLAARVALARIQAETAAKQKEAQDNAGPDEVTIWKNKTPATEVTAGGSKINLKSNTLTLSDGTVIDIKTGVKKVNTTA